MSDNITITAITRNDLGKGASRRLRRNAKLMPAVLYGAGEAAQSLSIAHKAMVKATENEAFFSSVLNIDLNGKIVPAIIKDLQRHPARAASILHADFQRIDMKKKIQMHIPLHFINEEQSHGVKVEGGRVQHNLVEVEISCLPSDLPEFIDVDMLEVKVGDIVHISDLQLPDGVESVALQYGSDHDLPIASLTIPKGSEEDDVEEESAAEPDADAADDE
jgi:large subunit ribosomal protein L25